MTFRDQCCCIFLFYEFGRLEYKCATLLFTILGRMSFQRVLGSYGLVDHLHHIAMDQGKNCSGNSYVIDFSSLSPPLILLSLLLYMRKVVCQDAPFYLLSSFCSFASTIFSLIFLEHRITRSFICLK